MSMCGVNERQTKILDILKNSEGIVNCNVLHDTLQVSTRTLRTDFAYLKKAYPDNITVKMGRHGGIIWKQG